MKFGFVKVASAIPQVRVTDCTYNVEQILSMTEKASAEGVEIVLFPELSITSCSCGDLFHNRHLLQESEKALQKLIEETKNSNMVIVVGAPVRYNATLLNCAVVLHGGKIAGAVPKKHIPNHDGLSEGRWFASGTSLPAEATTVLCGQSVNIGMNMLFTTPTYSFGIEIGDDLFAPSTPGSELATGGAQIILNPSASNETAGRHEYIKQLCITDSARNNAAYIYSGCGYGESSGDSVYSGNIFIAENGVLLNEGKRFSMQPQLVISEIDTELLDSRRAKNSSFTPCNGWKRSETRVCHIAQEPTNNTAITRKYDATPFIPNDDKMDARCEEIFSIQSMGLAKRIEHTHADSCVIGISGGLDSTLALLVTVKAFDLLGKDRKKIAAVTMPGFGTTDRTYNNALCLMKNLGVSMQEISIKEACIQHFEDIGHDINRRDVTYENSQARERTQILMDLSNRTNGFVVGTGDLSELALGWATYNGDHMSMYGVNASVPKTLVKYLVKWIALNSADEETSNTLLDIVDTPISPELIPAHDNGEIKQKTEDLVGPYELHDFFIYHTLRNGFTPAKLYFIACKAFEGAYDAKTIKKWLTTFYRRFFTQQFKRSCMPDGPKVGSCDLSPRGDWHMPSDACVSSWLAECEAL